MEIDNHKKGEMSSGQPTKRVTQFYKVSWVATASTEKKKRQEKHTGASELEGTSGGVTSGNAITPGLLSCSKEK